MLKPAESVPRRGQRQVNIRNAAPFSEGLTAAGGSHRRALGFERTLLRVAADPLGATKHCGVYVELSA